jgi:PAS domain S-box-containing protein
MENLRIRIAMMEVFVFGGNMKTREDPRRRIFSLLPQAFGAAAAGLGFTVLFGWLSGHPLLASFGANLIPTAPSTALLCVLLGLSILFRSRFPLNRGVAFIGTALGSLGVVAAFLLFYASSAHIYSSVELLGISITGTFNGVPIGHMSPLTALICALIALSFLGSLSSSPERRGRAFAAFVSACILTLMSTALVLAYLLATPLMYGSAFTPPALPTSLCSLFLALAVLSLTNLQVWPSSTTEETGVARSLYASILIFVLLSSGILATGYVYHRQFERQHRAEIEDVLASVSDLKVSELKHWREERLGGAAQFYGNTTFSRLVERSLRIPESVDARIGILTWFRQAQEGDQYDRISLYDPALVERFSYPNGFEPVDSLFLRHAATALRSREIVFQDFYRDEHTDRAFLNILIPICDIRNSNRMIGMVAMRIDPDTYVYPLLIKWPTPSRTAETLLIRKDGNNALFLNRLKFNNDAALKLRIPLESTDVPAVKAALGQTGIIEGRDYRGMPVIADLHAVPDSPWFLVARMDLSEVYEPLTERLWITVFIMCGLLIGAGTGVGLLWREQKARFYRDHYLAGRERAWLHDVIARSLNEIYVFDPGTLQFKFANAGAQHNIGYTTQELAGLSALDIKPEYTEQSFRAAVQPLLIGREMVLVFETVHRRKDGTRYPVESHLQLVERPEGAVILAIVNDITERKRTEKAKRESETLLQDIIDNSTSLIYILDTDGRFVLVNRKAESVLGISREQLIGKTRDAFLPQEIAAAHRNNDREVLRAGTSMTFEEENLEPDGRHTYLTVKFRLTNIEKSGYAVCGMSTDITERKRMEETLKASELRFRLAAGSLTDVIYEWDLKEKVDWYGDIDEMMGYPPGQFPRTLTGWAQLLHPDDRQLVFAAVDRQLKASAPYDLEYRIRRKDDAWRWWSARGSVRRDENGEPFGWIGSITDITERKRGEEESVFLASIIQSSDDAIFGKTPEGIILSWNAGAENMYGYPAKEVVGRNVSVLSPPDRPHEIEHLLERIGRDESIRQFETVRMTKDRKMIDVSLTLSPIRDAGGRVTGVSSITRDITRRKEAENELRRYVNQLSVINRLDRVISSTFDIEEVYDTVVSEMRHLLQFDRTSLMTLNEDGTEWQIVKQWTSGEAAFVPKTWRKVENSVVEWLVRNKRTLVESHIGEKGTWSETELLKKEGIASGVRVPLIVRGKVIGAMTLASKNPDAYKKGDVEILESLADQVGISIHNAAMYNKVEEHAATLEKRVAERTVQLEAANKELEAFSYSVSHDLRAPLRSIDGFSQIILEEYSSKFDAEGKRLLNVIRSNTQKMGELITDLLDLSRVARDEMKTVRIDMSTLANSIFHEVASPEAQKRYSLSVGALPEAYGDPSLMRQVWRNLISNAIKFTAPKDVRSIEIGGRSEEGKTIYFIRDSGVGFDPQYAHKLFGVFQRLHKTEEFEGTGVGLAIVQRIVHRHGGEVWAEGRIGEGATFYFSLTSKESNREQQP